MTFPSYNTSSLYKVYISMKKLGSGIVLGLFCAFFFSLRMRGSMLGNHIIGIIILLILVNLVLDNTARCLNMIILFSIDGWQYYAGRWFVDNTLVVRKIYILQTFNNNKEI